MFAFHRSTDGHSDCIYFLTYIVSDPVNMGGQIPLPQTYFLYFEPILLSHLENENLSFSIIHMELEILTLIETKQVDKCQF